MIRMDQAAVSQTISESMPGVIKKVGRPEFIRV